jgi:hypothetical protein
MMARLAKSARKPAARQGGNVDYLRSAPVESVLFEQLEYLVRHSSADCPPGCMDCERFERVRDELLRPFREARS